MDMDIDGCDSTEGGSSRRFKTPFLVSHQNCMSYSLLEDGFISTHTPVSTSRPFDSVHFDASCMTDSHLEDFTDEAHLSINLKVSGTSEDSGVFSEVGADSLDVELLSQSHEQRVQTSFPSKRYATPIDARSPKYFCGSSGTPHELDIMENSFSVAFKSTPYSVIRTRSPKHRRCRKYSRDLFHKQPSSAENSPSPYNVSLIGQEAVDFLAHLGQHSRLQPALDAVFGYLDPEDLCRASLVSRSWKSIIENVPSSRNRKKTFLEQRAQIKENLHQIGKKSDVSENFPHRGQLLSIQNLNRSVDVNQVPSRSPPVSPSKVRFNLFLKEGQKLENGQALVPCPKCKLPSRRKSENSALCTRRGCQFYFCVQCLCMFHEDRPCPVSVKHRKRQVAIGSRQSRRNLLRLCQ